MINKLSIFKNKQIMFMTSYKLNPSKICKTCKNDHNIIFDEKEVQSVIEAYIDNKEPNSTTVASYARTKPLEEIFKKYTGKWSDFYLYLLNVLFSADLSRRELNGEAKRTNRESVQLYGIVYKPVDSLWYKNTNNNKQIRSTLLHYRILMNHRKTTDSEEDFLDKIADRLLECLYLRTEIEEFKMILSRKRDSPHM
jgi:hypothetical protein